MSALAHLSISYEKDRVAFAFTAKAVTLHDNPFVSLGARIYCFFGNVV